MPHRVVALRRLNRFLDRLEPDKAPLVLEALRSTTDLGDAAAAAGLVDGADDVDIEAVREALAGLPPAIAASLHATLLSAAERELPVVVQWRPGSEVELHVWEALDDGVGQVGVLLISPRGSELALG
jgi:hypothetical protein